jgi:hypothetical protein
MKKQDCETRWIKWWRRVYNNNWIWKQIVKVLKDKQKIILKMEKSMQELQKPHIKIQYWIDEFWKQKKDL